MCNVHADSDFLTNGHVLVRPVLLLGMYSGPDSSLRFIVEAGLASFAPEDRPVAIPEGLA